MKNTKKIPTLRFSGFYEEWEVKKIVQIADIYDGTHQTPTYVEKGIKFVSVEDINNLNNTKKFITEEAFNKEYKIKPRIGDILMTRITAGIIGATAIIKDNEPLGYYVSLALIRAKGDFNIPFLNQIINSYKFKNELHKRIIHVAFPKKINLGDISECIVSFPTKKEEQQKIADFLTQIDNRIEKLTKKKQLLEKYKKGLMQKIFNQEIRFKDDNGEDYPEWEVKKLGEIAKFRRGSFPQPYGLEKWYDDVDGMPFIQVFDVNDNFSLKDKTKRKISKEAQLQSVFVEIGSILITIQGSIGRIAITQYPAYVDRTLLLFESFKININKYYFSYILFLLFEIEKEKAPGGIIKTITKEVLTNFEVFICDYEEQTKIANFLTEIDKKINLTEKKLNGTKKYKKGLLQQMFI